MKKKDGPVQIFLSKCLTWCILLVPLLKTCLLRRKASLKSAVSHSIQVCLLTEDTLDDLISSARLWNAPKVNYIHRKEMFLDPFILLLKNSCFPLLKEEDCLFHPLPMLWWFWNVTLLPPSYCTLASWWTTLPCAYQKVISPWSISGIMLIDLNIIGATPFTMQYKTHHVISKALKGNETSIICKY